QCLQPGRELGIGDDDSRVGVANHVVELGRRVGGRERNGDAAGAPDAPLRGHVTEARRHEERDPCLAQVVLPTEQTPGHAGGGVEQVAIGEGALGRADRGPLGILLCAGDEHGCRLDHTAARGKGDYCAVQPPSTGSAAPVIWAASSEQRNAASRPSCSTVTNCPEGCFSASSARAPSSRPAPSAAARAAICGSISSVRVQPGQIALQVIPDPAVSSATTLVRPTTPCFAATSAALLGDAATPCAAAVLTVRPQR